MERRAFVAGMATVLVAPLAAQTQQAEKVYRIGFLWDVTGGRCSAKKAARSGTEIVIGHRFMGK